MLTKKAKYALLAVVHLADEYNKGPQLISSIAQKAGVPKKFLELILLELKNNGVLASRKGKGGGYFLAKPPDMITMGQIVRLIDGPLAALPCVSQTAYQRCAECTDELTCGVRIVMKEVRDATARILDNASLLDVQKKKMLYAGAKTEVTEFQS